jgi:hypothetical protein
MPEQPQQYLPADLANFFRHKHYPRWLVNAIAAMERCLFEPGRLADDGPKPPAAAGVPTEARVWAAKAIVRAALVALYELVLQPDVEHPD